MKVISALIILLPFLAQANVDMVMGDAAQDELIISWSYNNSSFAGKYSGTEFTQIVAKPGMNTGIVTIAEDSEDEKHILFLPYVQDEFGDNAEVISYSYSDFAYEGTTPFYNMETNDRFGFLKSQDDRWDVLLAYSYMAFTSSGAWLNISQSTYSIATNGDLSQTGEASWDNMYYNKGSETLSQYYPAMMMGPVVCPGGYPLVATSFGCNSTQEWLVNHALVFDPNSTELLCHTIGEDWDPDLSGVMGLGSSSDTEAILVFADDTGDVNWSVFSAFTPVPESTAILPWGFPEFDDPMAFTSTFELPGMLMVWYRDGEIRCRHWDGQWNNYDYFVANSLHAPDIEEIAVCADTDGYWIAWLPGTASEPEVVFVNFNDVTGVAEDEYLTVDAILHISPLTNPVCGNLSVEVSGISCGIITVTDLCGRTVLEREIAGEGIHSLGELPASGIFFVRLHYSTGEVSCRVISM